MRAADVLIVLDALESRGLRAWLDGGWGVDALLHEQTRRHDDVDLVVELDALRDVQATLETLGFALAEDHAPARVVLRAADGRQVDLHLVSFTEDGTGWQRGASPDGSDCPYPASGFGQGSILDRVVPCLTADLQVQHHTGYEPRDRDRADMAHLARRFGLPSAKGFRHTAGMHRDDVMRWVARYEAAWRDDDLEAVEDLFSADARYRPSPYEESEIGHDAIRAFWLDDKGKTFSMSASPVAVDGRDAVVRVVVSYGDPVYEEYCDLWVLHFTDDGRVDDFEEWAYWPGRPYSAAQPPS